MTEHIYIPYGNILISDKYPNILYLMKIKQYLAVFIKYLPMKVK